MEFNLNSSENNTSWPFIFYFRGNYAEAPTSFIASFLENNIKRSNNTSHLKKVLFILIETLQNIEKYSASTNSNEDFSLVLSDNEFYYILTQNLINKKNASVLKDKLDTIKTKTIDELNNEYLIQLESGERTEKGAGLGLIEIARKTNNNLTYDFTEFDDKNMLYNLCFALPVDRKSEDKKADFSLAYSTLESIKRKHKNNTSTLIYKGDFSNIFLKTLIDMLMIMKSQTKTLDKRTHHILIELIQNINKHGHKENTTTDAQLLIEWEKNGILISTRNEITQQSSESFKEKVNKLNQSDKQQLMDISHQHLSDLDQTNGLGLIDISNLIYPEKINYHLLKKSPEIFLLDLGIRINNE